MQSVMEPASNTIPDIDYLFQGHNITSDVICKLGNMPGVGNMLVRGFTF